MLTSDVIEIQSMNPYIAVSGSTMMIIYIYHMSGWAGMLKRLNNLLKLYV